MMYATYHKEGDYYIPDLYLAKYEYKKDYQIGKYGNLRLEYLKNYKKMVNKLKLLLTISYTLFFYL